MTEIKTHNFRCDTIITEDKVSEHSIAWIKAWRENGYVAAIISDILRTNRIDIYEIGFSVELEKIIVRVGKQQDETLDAIMGEIAICYFGIITLLNQDNIRKIVDG